MKKLLWLLPLLIFACKKQDVINNPVAPLPPPVIATLVNGNQTVLVADTTIDSIWDGKRPDGSYKLLTITDGYKIHGKGIFQHWDLDASVNQEIFDTTITIKNITTAKTPFSVTWYGAHVKNSDNWWNIQKSFNLCKDYALICQLPEHGSYKFSKPLSIATMVNGVYQQCSIKIFGDATFWSNQYSTTLAYTGTVSPAINFQLNKGSVFAYIGVSGLWKSPSSVDSIYFNLPESGYVDQSTNHLDDNYAGVAIDYFYDGHSRSGSTGIEMDHLIISGFAKGLIFSANGYTQNDDIISVDYLNFLGNIKYGVWTSQPQEKGNSIDNIGSWGSIYCVVHHWGGGSYSFDVANIAGRPVKLLDVSIGHWFESSVSNWNCESVGYIGNFSLQMPFRIDNCGFNMDYFMGVNSKQRNVLTSNSPYLNIHGSTIRYYNGLVNDVYYHGYVTAPPAPDNYFGGGNFISR